MKLGQWCNNVCKSRNGKAKVINLTDERINQLDSLNFCWGKIDSKFIENVNRCIDFYSKRKRRPSRYSENEYERKLGNFILNKERDAQNSQLANWKINLLNQIPDFRQYSNKKKSVSVKIIDMRNIQCSYVYSSVNEASKALFNVFHITKTENSALSSIYNRLIGQTTTPYKDRFMFCYVDGNEELAD